MSNFQIVNIVGSGDLGVELDLEEMSLDISGIEYDPSKYPGAYIRIGDCSDGPLTVLYRTGKYIITGVDTKEGIDQARSEFLNILSKEEIIQEAADKWFQIQNIVCTADLDLSLNLDLLAVNLGLERTEYEPEIFPGLVYRPPAYDCVLLLFSSGRVVVTGSQTLEIAESAFEDVRKKVTDIE